MSNLTNRQIISDIVNDLRATNLDERVSRRFILHKLRDYASLYIKRDAEARRILGLSELWTEIPCVELCEAPIVDCCSVDIPGCVTVMKSVKKLPKAFETMYKELIQIFNVQYAKEFRQITPQEYKNIITREFNDRRIKYFWIQNNHIIVPDSMVKVVTLRGVFINPAEAKKLSECESSDEACPSTLDQPFICPDYLLAIVKDSTLKDLFTYYKRVIVDEAPNLNTNIKVNKDQ